MVVAILPKIEAMDTYLVNAISKATRIIERIKTSGAMARRTPNPTADPLPPLNRKKIENIWPKMESSPARITSQGSLK
jgi:hypothetical protein